MQLLDLPNELLLDIFKQGGTEALIGGTSRACRRLRSLSNEAELWNTCLAPQFTAQHLTLEQIDAIPDFRAWYLEQRDATKRVTEGVDVLAKEMRDSHPEDIELYAWQVLRHRLRACEALKRAREQPRSIAHYHWAHWLTEIMYRLEGVHLLLQMSMQDEWGNGIVENPLNQVIALYSLRNGCYPEKLVAASRHSDVAAEINSEIDSSDKTDHTVTLEWAQRLVQHVMTIFSTVSKQNDFLAVLGRGALFVDIATRKLGWKARLLKLPLGSYVSVDCDDGDEVFFVDFQRKGMLRDMQDIRDRIHHMGAANNVQYGISLYDTLSAAYVWHTQPTSSRHCVLDLIEHAANEVHVTTLTQAPRIFMNLVRRIISRNIAEVENAPLSRAVSSSSLVSMVDAYPGGWLRKGKVVQVPEASPEVNRDDTASPISPPAPAFTLGAPAAPPAALARDTEAPTQAAASLTSSESSPLAVVLEVNEVSAVIIYKSERKRIIKQMLQPCFNVLLVTIAGLQVPDTGADMCILGQYFLNYNVQREQFE